MRAPIRHFTIRYVTPPSTNMAGIAHKMMTGMAALLWMFSFFVWSVFV